MGFMINNVTYDKVITFSSRLNQLTSFDRGAIIRLLIMDVASEILVDNTTD